MARKDKAISPARPGIPVSTTRGIRIVWTGDAWLCHLPPHPKGLAAGTEFIATVHAPAVGKSALKAAGPVSATSSNRLMFPAGTTLYLPIHPAKNSAELYGIFEKAWAAGPFLRQRPKEKALLPIVLDDDLLVRGKSESLEKCRCHVLGRRQCFESLNALAKWALVQWTSRATGSMNVFDGVCFVDRKRLLFLSHRREEILRSTPLPEPEEARFDDLTPELF